MNATGALTLADLPRLGVHLTWQEAVAIVLEACDQVKRGGEMSVTPDLAHVAIVPTGDVAILPGSPIPRHPVQQTATLLAALLPDSSTPEELRQLVLLNLMHPPRYAWIEEFTTALAYFERPRRRETLATVAARMLAQSHDSQTATGTPPPRRKADRHVPSERWSRAFDAIARSILRWTRRGG